MALFCDFENVALGVRDTKYQKFDIRPVLERLLLKGSIVVKKAYCDWDRYKDFKSPMHEANFELIEIPHVRQSGKNSADIRLVVDALDFCYTKSHVNTFVIISGDSDFSPLVSKLRENNKKVIGVGVKQSTSDLLVANCDEFIFYDDLAREIQRAAESGRDSRGQQSAPQQRRTPDEEHRRKEESEARKTKAVKMVVETFEALTAERGDSGKIWASALKDALKRRRPDFNESYYGFRAFGNLLDEAQSRGFLEVGREENSSTYVYRSGAEVAPAASLPVAQEEPRTKQTRRTRGGRRSEGAGRGANQTTGQEVQAESVASPREAVSVSEVAVVREAAPVFEATPLAPTQPSGDLPSSRDVAPSKQGSLATTSETEQATIQPAPEQSENAPAPVKRSRTRSRSPSKKATEKATATTGVASKEAEPTVASSVAPDVQPADATVAAPAKTARKTTRSTTPRTRRPRKTASTES
ncbi:NYN domain-containing protein [Bordetella tumulicola]